MMVANWKNVRANLGLTLDEEAIIDIEKSKSKISFYDAIQEAQEQAVINGTTEMTMDEINKLIAEIRRKYKGSIDKKTSKKLFEERLSGWDGAYRLTTEDKEWLELNPTGEEI